MMCVLYYTGRNFISLHLYPLSCSLNIPRIVIKFSPKISYCTYVDIQKFNIKYSRKVQGAYAYMCNKLVRVWFVRLYGQQSTRWRSWIIFPYRCTDHTLTIAYIFATCTNTTQKTEVAVSASVRNDNNSKMKNHTPSVGLIYTTVILKKKISKISKIDRINTIQCVILYKKKTFTVLHSRLFLSLNFVY